jgi:hypothetical protein
MSHVIQQGSGEKGLEPGEISATFMVLTTAGSETTATTLCGAMNYLIAHPEKLVILKTEIRSSFQHTKDITLAAVQGLHYLTAVINEALRLCPAVPWILPRIVPEGGDTVCGTWLPGGVSLISCLMLMSCHLTISHPRHRFRYKHGRSIAIPNISTMPNCLTPSGGWPMLQVILILPTITTRDKLLNHSAQARGTVWANIWHGPRCDSFFRNC